MDRFPFSELGMTSGTSTLALLAFAIAQLATFGTALLAYIQSRKNTKLGHENKETLKNVETNTNGAIDELKLKLSLAEKTIRLLTGRHDDKIPPTGP